MPMQDYLHQQIQKVCPINGISFGDLDDKSTWRIDYKDEATGDQKKAAIDLLDSFVWDEKTREIDRKYNRDLQYSNDLSIKSGYSLYLKENPGITFSQYLDYLETF